MHAGPPSDAPNKMTLRLSAALSTVPMSWTVASTLGVDPIRSECPMPRRSSRIRRPISARENRNARHRGSSQTKTGQHQNINAAGGVGLEREMDAATADVPCRRWAFHRQRCASVQKLASLGFGRHVELVAKTLRQRLKVALGGGPISGEQ